MLCARRLPEASRAFIPVAALVVLTSCSRLLVGPAGTPSVSNGSEQLGLLNTDRQPVIPDVSQNGKHPMHWTRFLAPSGSHFVFLQDDPSGDYMWLSDAAHGAMVQLTMNGKFTAYPLSTPSGPFTPGYFTFVGSQIYVGGCIGSACNVVGIFTPKSKQFQIFKTPSGDGPGISHELTYGPDQNVWFTEGTHVGKLAASGVITEYPAPTIVGLNIISGGDGKIWFDGQTNTNACVQSAYFDSQCPWVAQMDPATGSYSQYYLGMYSGSFFEAFGYLGGGMTVANGNVYVLCGLNTNQSYGDPARTYLDEVSTTGDQTLFKLHHRQEGWTEASLTSLPNGDLWWGLNLPARANGIATWNPTQGVKAYIDPYQPGLLATVAGGDGNIWSIAANSNIVVYILNVISVSPKTLTLTGPKNTGVLTVMYGGSGTLKAESLNGNVARVAQSGPLAFTVTAVRAGKTQVVVGDSSHNSFAVDVTVH
jgi:hypothetical protein